MDWGLAILVVTLAIFSAAVLGIVYLIHEAGHVLACWLYGVEIEGVMFGWPTIISTKKFKTVLLLGPLPIMGGIQLKVSDITRHNFLAIYAAGMVVNLVVAVVCSVYLILVGYQYSLANLFDTPTGLIAFFTGLNYGMVITNIIPLPIHDGHRILSAIREFFPKNPKV